MKWGFLVKKVETEGFFGKKVKNGGVFCKNSGKWGVVKKWKMGGVFCKKKLTFSQCRVHYVQYQYFLFYILLIWGVRTHPVHPPCLRA